jgi:hypothetical protein
VIFNCSDKSRISPLTRFRAASAFVAAGDAVCADSLSAKRVPLKQTKNNDRKMADHLRCKGKAEKTEEKETRIQNSLMVLSFLLIH